MEINRKVVEGQAYITVNERTWDRIIKCISLGEDFGSRSCADFLDDLNALEELEDKKCQR